MTNPNDRELYDRVMEAGQGHVFRWWPELPDSSRKKLLAQLHSIDFDQVAAFQKALNRPKPDGRSHPDMKPAHVIRRPVTDEEKKKWREAAELGKTRIQQGRVGVFLVAGGQGTRLGFDGPKGCYPIGPVTNKSIFQFHAEKILAAENTWGVCIPWYIMTSEANHESTSRYFHENKFFGLSPEDVFFNRQRMVPALDGNGKLILDARDHIFMNPNGHGGAFEAMADGDVLDNAEKRGVDVLSYFQVDNVLIRIIDPVFIGFHEMARAQMSSKMCRKRGSEEKVGHFVTIDNQLNVIEYIDMPDEYKAARNPDGSLRFDAGSIGIHLINIDFVRHESSGGIRLPLHVANKKIRCIMDNGSVADPEKPNGFKFETFIFDALKDTERSIVLEVERDREFSPVKNKNGADSPRTARQDLTNYYGSWLSAAGMDVKKDSSGNVCGRIEISPLFARDLQEFLEKDLSGLVFKEELYLGPDQSGS